MNSLSAGSEIDAWCTKCKMVLSHRIIAMVGKQPVRVICQTCDSQHNYKKGPPKDASLAVVPVIRSKDGTLEPARASSPPPKKGGNRSVNKAGSLNIRGGAGARTNDWETRVLGQPVTAFTRYAMTRRFALGELVTHSKFGDGYVAEVLEGNKLNIIFKDGARTLAHCLVE